MLRGLLLFVGVASQLVAPAYFLAMRRVATRRSPPPHAPPSPLGDRWPSVTVILATYNEAATLEQRLRNLAQEQERYHGDMDAIMVDSASTDGTSDLASGLRRALPRLRLRIIREDERRGKAHALRRALPLARGEVVVLTDADCAWEPGALSIAVERFQDARVGAVTGAQVLVSGGGAADAIERRYHDFYATLRAGESALGSTPIVRGELAAFRARLVAHARVGEQAPAADDSELAMRVTRAGYRVVVEPRARFVEYAPPTLAARRRQKARRGAGLQQLFARNLGVALRPRRYGWTSLAVAANAWMLLAAPLGLVALAIGTAMLSPWLLGAGALVVLLAPGSTPSGYARSQLALLLAMPLALRADARWRPISEVRALWAAGPPSRERLPRTSARSRRRARAGGGPR